MFSRPPEVQGVPVYPVGAHLHGNNNNNNHGSGYGYGQQQQQYYGGQQYQVSGSGMPAYTKPPRYSHSEISKF